MKVLQLIVRAIQYLSEGMAELFSPSKDNYPATGIVPYTGIPYDETVWN